MTEMQTVTSEAIKSRSTKNDKSEKDYTIHISIQKTITYYCKKIFQQNLSKGKFK